MTQFPVIPNNIFTSFQGSGTFLPPRPPKTTMPSLPTISLMTAPTDSPELSEDVGLSINNIVQTVRVLLGIRRKIASANKTAAPVENEENVPPNSAVRSDKGKDKKTERLWMIVKTIDNDGGRLVFEHPVNSFTKIEGPVQYRDELYMSF
jgi:hypothetical protein